METGCPAVDKGANQPNVFYDPKSSESALPYYAEERRDDFMQRRYLQALIEGFDPAHEDYVAGRNPVSPVYGGRMIDLDRIFAYAWDARPFPAFPADGETWGDAPNWRFGHWLNGRFASLPLDEAVRQLMEDFGFHDFDAEALEGSLPGYVIDRIMSAREALQPLELAYFFDAIEVGGLIAGRHRGLGGSILELDAQCAVEERPGAALVSLVRGQETELPAVAKVRYVSAGGDYRGAVADARRTSVRSARVAQADLAIMLEDEQASAIAERWLHEAWAARDTAQFVLPPSDMVVEPGDLIDIPAGGRERLYRVTSIGDRDGRHIEARSIDPEIYAGGGGPARESVVATQSAVGTAAALFVDLPLLRGDEPETAGYVALFQAPWPGSLAIYRSPSDAGFELAGISEAPATTGLTLTDLPAGPLARRDRGTVLRVALNGGALLSATRLKVLGGGNALAVRTAAGTWELLQFETATLVDTLTYELRGLLRGQAGTDGDMAAGGVAAGAPVVVVNSALLRLDLAPGLIGLPLNWRFGPANRDIGHASYSQSAHAFAGVGRRPLSPAHLKGARNPAGDLSLTWVRRTRVGGDSWEVAEVPLGEETEAYEIDFFDNGAVVRTLAVNVPEAVYAAADQVAVFGGVREAVDCAVYQMSATWGRGSPRFATV